MIRNRNLVLNEVMRTTILWTAGYYSFQDRLLSVFCIRYLINLDVHALKIVSCSFNDYDTGITLYTVGNYSSFNVLNTYGVG
jgi:hypothetical protein